MQIKDKLRKLRQKQRLTMLQLGNMSSVTATTICDIENGNIRAPNLETADNIAKSLNVSIADVWALKSRWRGVVGWAKGEGEMIDRHELNKEIVGALGVVYVRNDKLETVFFTRDGESMPREFDFNNWDDLMPLVVEHKEALVNFPIDIAFNCRDLAECLLKVLKSKR